VILHLAPDAPLVARWAADAALFGHIGGGVAGIGAGYVTVAARKGGPLHRAAGKAFIFAMGVAYAIGAIVAPMIHQPGNSFGGVFAIYLIVTGWIAVRRPAGDVGRIETGAMLAAAASGIVLLAMALLSVVSPRILGGVPWPVFVILAAICALAARADLSAIRQGGLAGAARLRRHIWRMSAAFFFGTGSLFLGQPRVFPPGLRGSLPLIALALAPLAIMAFWLIRHRTPRPSARPVAGALPAQEALT